MTLINEKWYVYENGSFRVASNDEISKHVNRVVSNQFDM